MLKKYEIRDELFFEDLHSEMHPLYYDIFESIKDKGK
jgi:hypothetical protein